MTPTVKRWDIIIPISVLLAIVCMVTGGGCSKPTAPTEQSDWSASWDSSAWGESSTPPIVLGGVLTVEIAEQADYFTDLEQFSSISYAAVERLSKHAAALWLEGLTMKRFLLSGVSGNKTECW